MIRLGQNDVITDAERVVTLAHQIVGSVGLGHSEVTLHASVQDLFALGTAQVLSADGATTRGDLIYSDANDNWTRLALGTTSQHLESDGTDVAWQTNLTMADTAWIGLGAASPRLVFESAGNELGLYSGLVLSLYSDAGVSQTGEWDASDGDLTLYSDLIFNNVADGIIHPDAVQYQLLVHDGTRFVPAWMPALSIAQHAILSTHHSDIVTEYAVAQGAMIIGVDDAGTDAWARLAHPAAAGYALTTDATDVAWDQTPAWTGEHTFNAGLAVADDQDLTFGDGDDATIRYDEAGDNRVEVGGANWQFAIAGLSITSAASTMPILEIENTNEDTVTGVIEFYKNSVSPADNDDLGAIDFYGETSTSAKERYAYILSESLDVTDGDTGGGLRFEVVMDATERNLFEIKGYNGAVNQGEVVVNEDGQDVDFIVEASGVNDALIVQGSDGQITLGALGAGVVQSTAGGVLSSGTIDVGDISDLAYAVPALTFTTANAAGAANTVMRTDASLAIFDATVPNTIEPDDAAAVGVVAFAARRDHEHAIVCAAPAADSVNVAASAEGSATSFARSDHAHNLDEAIAPTWTGQHYFSNTLNALTDLSDPSNYHVVIRNPADDTGEMVALGFYISVEDNDVGGAIGFYRTGAETQGELRFYTKRSTGETTDPVLALTLTQEGYGEFAGRVGVNQASPVAWIHVNAPAASTIPALMLDAETNGELVTPDGDSLRIGHYNSGTTTFTERFRLDGATGDLIFASGTQLQVATNTWIGIGSGSERITFQGTGDTVQVAGGCLQITGDGTPAAGSGVVIEWDGSTGDILSYNYTSPAYLPIRMRGSVIQMVEGATVVTTIDGGNLGLKTTSWGGGVGVLGIANAGTNPSSNPTAGGLLYSDGGAGKWRGSGGTTTTFGPAEPHCPTCGRDFVLEWDNPDTGHLIVCMWCLSENLEKGVVKRDN